jgi:hypothetical protein
MLTPRHRGRSELCFLCFGVSCGEHRTDVDTQLKFGVVWSFPRITPVSGERVAPPVAPDLAIGGDFDCSEPEKVTNGDRHTPDPPDG